MPWGNNVVAAPANYVVPGDTSGSTAPNIFAEGTTPTFTWTGAGSRTNSTYEVISALTGEVIETGSAAASPLILTETYPAGGYTLHIYQDPSLSPDAVYGDCQGVTYFVVWTVSPTLPAPYGLRYHFDNDFNSQPQFRGSLGIGGRLTIDNLLDTVTGGIDTLSSALDEWTTYQAWANSPPDPVRPPVVPVVSMRNYVNGMTIVVTSATGGTYTATYDGQTATIAHNANNATVKSALEALSSIGSGHVKEFNGKFWLEAPNTSTLQTQDIILNGAGLTGGGAAVTGTFEATGVAAVVAACYDVGLIYFEATNEPFNSLGLGNGALFVPYEKAFSQQVHGSRPGAQVLGPCHVTVNDEWNNQFLDGGGGTWIDELSFHPYNSCNGDLFLSREVMDTFFDDLDRRGWTPGFMTEFGQFAFHYGLYDPGLQARWWMSMLLILEQYGVPKEYTNYFYDKGNGFGSYPSQLAAGGGQLNATPVTSMLRVLNDELYGKVHLSRLSFGDDEDYTLGSVFGPDGSGNKVMELMSAGRTDHVLAIDVTGAANLTVVSADGDVSTTPVTAGQAFVTLANSVPVYVRIPNGVTATIPATDYGTDLALSAVATTTGAGVDDVSKVNDGVRRNWYNLQTGSSIHDASAPYIDDTVASTRSVSVTTNSTDTISFLSGVITTADLGLEIGGGSFPADCVVRELVDDTHAQVFPAPSASASITATITNGLPADITLTWGGPVTISRCVVECPPPWQNQGALRDFSLKYSLAAGAAVTLATFSEDDKTFPFVTDIASDGGNKSETYYSGRCVFVWEGSEITADKLWIHVTNTTIGGHPGPGTLSGGELGPGLRRPVIRRFQAFSDSGTPPPTPSSRARSVRGLPW